MDSRRKGVRASLLCGAFAWFLATGAAQAGQKPQAAGGGQAAGYAGQDTCLTCHAEMGKVYTRTAHGHPQNPRAPAAQRGCESCHGPGKAHADAGGDKTKIKSFKGLTAAQINETCETCHNRGTHANWMGSRHEQHDLSCTTCHSIHHFKSETAQLVAVNDVETCATCHHAEAQKVRRVAHMPVREGKMGCASCHNPHGSSNVRLLRAGSSIAESCTSCHAAQRGPYLWEHAPVRDKCTTCHDPHGSSNDRMLVAKMPMLCQRCHVSTRHPSTNYDATLLPQGAGGTSTSTSANRLVNRSCINCHQAIHGSNHPGGVHFLR